MSALDAARAIAAGWRAVRPHDRLEVLPQADGGEGTLDVIAATVTGARRQSAGEVCGPDGRPVAGEWLHLPDGVAVVELAQSSGIGLMRQLDAMNATTRGLGQVIRHALSHAPSSLMVALGGSASTDGGAGALAALGLVLRDRHGAVLPDGGVHLADLHTVDPSGLARLPAVTLLTDVNSPLLGPRGSASVFAPQKGASDADIAALERGLAHFAELMGGSPDAPGMGAAGGTAYGLAATWPATFEPGARYISRVTGLDAAIARADVVLTGEGRFDDQSLSGKVTGSVLAAASAAGAVGGIIAGVVQASPAVWSTSLVEIAGSTAEALRRPGPWLQHAGRLAAHDLGATLSRTAGP